MPNTIIQLKKSSTPGARPTTTNLANGELAINFADGRLYYKNTANLVAEITFTQSFDFGTVSANGTLLVADAVGDILTINPGNNITIVGDAVNDKLTIGLTNDVSIPGLLSITAAAGDEGGEIRLANAVANSTLAGPVNIDIFQNKLRFFVSGGDARGAYINLAATSASVGTDLLAAASATDSTARATASAAFDKANAANVLAFNALPNTSGVTFNGTLNISQNVSADKVLSTNNGNGENFKIGDDAWLGDINLADTVRLKGQQNSSNGYIIFGTNDGVTLGRYGSNALTYGGNTVWHAGNSANASQAFDKANAANVLAFNALPNTSGVSFVGNLNFPSGNIGIGIVSPTSTLHVIGTANITGGAIINTMNVVPSVQASFDKANAANVLAFNALPNTSGVSFVGNLNFPNGNVGIGIASPTSRLHVIGAANITTDLIVGGNVYFDNTLTTRISDPAVNVLAIYTASTERLRVDATGNVGIGNNNPIATLHVGGNLFVSQNITSQLDVVGEIAEFAHNANSYTQVHVRNANTGSRASADLVVTADSGTDATDFIDLGINNSGFNDPTWTINNAKDGYLYTANGNLAIGVANTTKSITFFTGGILAANERLRVDPSGNVGIGTTSPAYKLQVAGSFAAQTKSFVINHPTKPDMMLRYGSLEGPENGVYVRGKLDGYSVIELPEYWWNLVDPDSITVNITPCGRAQDLWVQSVSAYAINLNQPAECFFTVFAERKDVDKLVVEF